ncbi:MAG TPA: DUF4412 domain-containing protein [Gemmatimonadaceae bacterium]|nr:DUF4412 domain-containing protein [Gemmatimonadaceae bacterium]
MSRLARWTRPAALAVAAGVLSVPMFPAVSHAQSAAFEGVVHITMTGDRGSIPVLYYIKGNVARMEMDAQGQEIAMIMNPASGKTYMIMPSQQVYMEMDLKKMQEQAQQQMHDKDPQVNKTGRTETVAGRQCEHWIISSGTDSADVCMAKGIGTFMQAMAPSMRQSEPAWQREAREQGMFPLKVSVAGGRDVWQVTQIEKKSLDDSLFTPPSEYQKMSMPGLPGQP